MAPLIRLLAVLLDGGVYTAQAGATSDLVSSRLSNSGRAPAAPGWSCDAFNCTCQGFADYYGTYAGRGFGCADTTAQRWWTGHRCHADAHCACCGGPACAKPGAAECICPDGPHPSPRPRPGPGPAPTPAIPPAIICPTPLEPEYVCKTCRGPQFSWDTLPVFVHVSKENTLAFSEVDLATLTKFPIVTIEKWQGCADPQYSFEEVAMLAAAKSIKDAAVAKSKHISVVVWFDSYRIYSNTTLNPDAKDSAGIACMNSRAAHFLESNPNHLLHNASGGLVLESFANLHVADYQKREMQVFKRDMCLNMTKSGWVDGCGMDGSQQRAGTAAIPGVADANAVAWNTGKICMMNGTTAAIGSGLALGKMEWELGGHRGYANGIIQEGCTNSNATVTNLRAVAERSLELGGVPLVYECHANCRSIVNPDQECISSIAAFLVGAGPNAYWGFGSWVEEGSVEPPLTERWGPIFERKLGAPVADAKYDAGSGVWTRSFASGTTVMFNAKTNSGSVKWSDNNGAHNTGSPPKQTGPWFSQPFVSGVGGYHSYRIPAMVTLPRKTATGEPELLAFCEGRKLNCDDVDWNDIVMRRSTDGGRSWGRQIVVHGEGTSKKHVCIGNPSPVVVASKPGRVVMTGTREVNEGFSVISDDYGETWGPAIYQPSLNAPQQRGSGAPPPAYGQNVSNWDFYMPGPAAGVQLPSGRLIVGAYHGVQFNKTKQGGEAFSFTIYSDSNGANWSWTDGHAYDVGPGAGECQIAPAPNGSLIMRTRTGRHKPPAFAWSNDNGTSWSELVYWTNDMMHADIYQHYIYHSCSRTKPIVCQNISEFGPFGGSNTQGSIARLPGSDLLVTSAPFAPTRANMTLWISSDSGKSWSIPANGHIYSLYSGYSALVGLNATHVGVLWEVSGDPPAGNPPGSGSPFHLSYTAVKLV